MSRYLGADHKEYYSAIGLYDFGFRFYSPSTGRFINRDPQGLAAGINSYRYAFNNPVSLVDIDGRTSIDLNHLTIGPEDYPWLEFHREEVKVDLAHGSMAAADGFNPFGDPFKDSQMYDPCDPYLKTSHFLGNLSRDLLITAATAGVGGEAAVGVEGAEAAIAAEEAAVTTEAEEIYVIGRKADAIVAKDWPNHNVLDVPDGVWTEAMNDGWVQGAIDKSAPIYIASPLNPESLVRTTAEARKISAGLPYTEYATVTMREVTQFVEAGYTRVGDYLLPPGRLIPPGG